MQIFGYRWIGVCPRKVLEKENLNAKPLFFAPPAIDELQGAVDKVAYVIIKLCIVPHCKVVPQEDGVAGLWPHCKQIVAPDLRRDASLLGIIAKHTCSTSGGRRGRIVRHSQCVQSQQTMP
jgi:hypothetical protein